MFGIVGGVMVVWGIYHLKPDTSVDITQIFAALAAVAGMIMMIVHAVYCFLFH